MAGAPQLQMNGTSASAIHALPASLPGQSASALTQKLAATQDSDQRRTMLGKSLEQRKCFQMKPECVHCCVRLGCSIVHRCFVCLTSYNT